MSKKCDICGKHPLVGCNVSHSHVRTKRRSLPNLQKVQAKIDGSVKTIRVCTRCLKANKVELA